MIRRVALLAALMAATAGSAYAAACLVTGAGPVLNGFETTGSACTVDFPEWTTAAATWDSSAAAGVMTPVQGGNFGWAAADATTISLTLTTGTDPVFASNNNWASPAYNYLFVAYASTTITADKFNFEFQLINSSSVNPAGFQTAAVLAGSATPPWTYLITSLNYAQNVGFAVSDVTQIRLVDFGPVFSTNLGIAYDDLQLDPASGTLDTPNSAVPSNQAGGTPSGCGTSFTLTWTAQTQSGTDTINGYHIYRSVTGPTGPWVSDGYVVGAGSGVISYTDIVAGMSTNQYYIILPYASTTTAFGGGAAGVFMGCNDNALDSHWVAADGGVNEALLNNADAVGPFNALVGCTPTDSPTPSSSPTPSLTASPTDTPSPSPSDTPTATPTFTKSPTPTGTPTITLTSTETNTPPPTNTPGGPTNTPTFTAVNTNTPVPTNTPVNTNTPGPTNTPTVYVSPTPVATVPYVQLYPNPFYPDRGQVSHLGPVPAGMTWSVFDIIGKFVYKATTTGNPALDVWYGYNADGMECSTGIYFLVLNGKIYRIGLVRN